MSIAYYLNCKTGNSYTDKEGKQRDGFMQVGRVVTTSNGGMMAILDGLPFGALNSKEPIVLYMNPPRDATQERKGPPPETKKGADNPDLQDDIPF